VGGGGGGQRGVPSGPDGDVVVEEGEQVAGGGGDRGVAGDVDAAVTAERDDLCAVLAGDRLGRLVGRAVDDDDDLAVELRAQAAEGSVEVGRAVARRDQDRNGDARSLSDARSAGERPGSAKGRSVAR
jgi:hypothetical protein